MKTAYDFYITPEEYEVAERNGVCAKTLNKRVRDLGWEKEKAITEPIRTNGEEWLSIKKIALSNGISRQAYRQRRIRGWNIEDSCSIPPLPRAECLRRATESSKRIRVFTDDELKVADENGINRSTLYHRYRGLKWNKEKSISRKTLTKIERGQLGAVSYRLKTKGIAI
ncbi:TPA: hypothetical protein ACHVKB_005419 [Bacillus cereus]